jgi:GT2 family glycosyltransferase
VQLIDGDCSLDPAWIDLAAARLASNPRLAIVCGRRRERHPEISAYNRLCDREWDTPIGITLSCGGDALARYDALTSVGGFDPSLIAGEEPDLCLRLRREGWQIERLDAEMVLHDAAITLFSQFWRRARRAGHAFAEGHWRHRHGPEAHYRRETWRALLWGAGLPIVILLCLVLHTGLGILLAAAYPAQILRLTVREGFTRSAGETALLLTLSKFAEAQGVIRFHLARLRRRRLGLIEYK